MKAMCVWMSSVPQFLWHRFDVDKTRQSVHSALLAKHDFMH